MLTVYLYSLIETAVEVFPSPATSVFLLKKREQYRPKRVPPAKQGTVET
jgi:hypothetical protein